jgi:hypothetical protein
MPPLDPNSGLPPIDTLNTIGHTDIPVVFTNWARNVINKTVSIVTKGKELNHIQVISHGVDIDIWKPLPNKQELRKKYFPMLGPNDFLVGSVSRSQPRKRFDANFMSMRKFIDKYEDSKRPLKWYFHCAMDDKLGWNLRWLADYYRVADRCIFNDKLKPGAGPSYEELNEIINCLDVHGLFSNSEGWCNLPKTNILTIEGYKNIEEIKKDELVFTHTGTFKKVIQPLSREYEGDIINIKSKSCGPNISVTPNHNIYIYRDKKFQWVRADNIKYTDRTCIPIPKKYTVDSYKLDISKYLNSKFIIKDEKIYGCSKPNKIHPMAQPINRYFIINEKNIELIGNFLSEGCSCRSAIKFCLNQKSDKEIRENITNFAQKNERKLRIENYSRNRQILTINSSILSEFFKIFGHTAKNKYIPKDIMEVILSKKELSVAMIKGLIDGDGS